MNRFKAWWRSVTFGGFVAKTLGVLLLLLALALVIVIWRIGWGTTSGPDLTRLQSFAVSVLLPTFQAVATVVVAAGVFKGVTTAVNNFSLSENNKTKDIDFFRW